MLDTNNNDAADNIIFDATLLNPTTTANTTNTEKESIQQPPPTMPEPTRYIRDPATQRRFNLFFMTNGEGPPPPDIDDPADNMPPPAPFVRKMEPLEIGQNNNRNTATTTTTDLDYGYCFEALNAVWMTASEGGGGG